LKKKVEKTGKKEGRRVEKFQMKNLINLFLSTRKKQQKKNNNNNN